MAWVTKRCLVAIFLFSIIFISSCGDSELHVRNELPFDVASVILTKSGSSETWRTYLAAIPSGGESTFQVDQDTYQIETMGMDGYYYVARNVKIGSDGYTWTITASNKGSLIQ